jgi:hypothetical protein
MGTLTARATGLVLAVSLLVPAVAAGQLSLEGRLGATMPTGDLTDLDQTAGLAFAAEIQYTVQRNLTLYGGLGHHRFTCDGCDDDFSTTGLAGGAKLILGASGRALPWIRGDSWSTGLRWTVTLAIGGWAWTPASASIGMWPHLSTWCPHSASTPTAPKTSA